MNRLDPAELRLNAATNDELYAFYAISVWVPNAEHPLDRLERTKLVKFDRYAELLVGDLTERDLKLWATGQSPHYDVVHADRRRGDVGAADHGHTLSDPSQPAGRPGGALKMIYIDLPADLNMEDDHGRNVARLSDAGDLVAIAEGAVVVAGAPGGCHGLSWMLSRTGSCTSIRSARGTQGDGARWSCPFRARPSGSSSIRVSMVPTLPGWFRPEAVEFGC